MKDEQIIELFWGRTEAAVAELKEKYGSRAQQLAKNILRSSQDAEECVNDALMVIWERIPPERPASLWAYFSRVVRNLSYSRLDYLSAARRDRGSEICLGELEGCFFTAQDAQQLLESQRITQVINDFLDGRNKTDRIIFVRRYYYFDSCAEIAKRVGLTRGAVNTRLSRLRQELREMLEKEDIPV